MRAILHAVCAALLGAVLVAAPALAQDHSRLYTPAELKADAKRLETAVRKIFELGLAPALTAEEKRRIGAVDFVFPAPEGDDYALDFYAYRENGRSIVAMPLLSLKALEDLTTAYAWIYSEQYSLSTIDLYFAMLQHRPQEAFPGGAYPAPLPALGVPADAYEHAPVDQLSLSLRNEAFAFVIIHELAHLFYAHKPYFEISAEEARRGETEADAFALDVLGRTGTPPLGPVLMFQAQAYSLPNRGQFADEKEWIDFLGKRSNHPLTTDRLRAMSAYIGGALAQKRPNEREIWAYIGGQLGEIAGILEDVELQACIAKLAKEADLSVLKPRSAVAGDAIAAACG